MKNFLAAFSVVLLVVVGSTGLLSAATVPSTASWQDMHNPDDVLLDWSPYSPNNPYTYTHTIVPDGFVVGEDVVKRFSLSIRLYDDAEPGYDASDRWWFTYDVAGIDLPGGYADRIVEVDYSNVELGWSFAGLMSLNQNGTLGIDIYPLLGDFYFADSTLTACGVDNSPNPTPLPPSVLLLGTGLAGLMGFRGWRASRATT